MPSSLNRSPLCAPFSKQKGWCLQYETSEATEFWGTERDASKDLDYFTLKVSFEREQQTANGCKVLNCIPGMALNVRQDQLR